MPDGDESKKQKEETKQNLSVDAKITYSNELLPKSGEITAFNPLTYVDGTHNLSTDNYSSSNHITFVLSKENVFDCHKIKEDFDNGKINANDIYNNFKTTIIENKNNPEVIDSIVSGLLQYFLRFYDHSLGHKKMGNNTLEMLENIFSTPIEEEIPGFVCVEIHEVLVNLLQDCGINAALMYGATNNGGHATLIYQREDNKYVFNNYDNSYIIDAPNIKEAIIMVDKYSGNFQSYGHEKIISKDGCHIECILKHDMAHGDELDKRDYNSKSLFNNKIPEESAIEVNLNNSDCNNKTVSLNVTLKHNKYISSDIGVEYKDYQNALLFDNSKSIGIKYESKIKYEKIFFNNKFLYSNLKGTICPSDNYTYSDSFSKRIEQAQNAFLDACNTSYNNIGNNYDGHDGELQSEIKYNSYNITEKNAEVPFEQKHNMFVYRGEVGYESSIVKNKNISIDNVVQCSQLIGSDRVKSSIEPGPGFSGISGSMDSRTSIEDGILFKKVADNGTFNCGLSAGINLDLKENGGDCQYGIMCGGKLNEEIGYSKFLNENTLFSVAQNGYFTQNASCREFGFGIKTSVVHKLSNRASLFAGAGVDYENQHLSVGGFNETTENNITVGTTIGANIKNLTINFSYKGKHNYIKPAETLNCISIGFNKRF